MQFYDLHVCNSIYMDVKMTSIRTTLPDVIRSYRLFSARTVHSFQPIHIHVLRRDDLEVKSIKEYFKIEIISKIGGYCLINI